MTSKSKRKTPSVKKRPKKRSFVSDYGFARVRDKAFDAVHGLWTTRRAQGVALKDVADKIGRDKGWLSKQMSGPGNWTLRTFGELVEALDGEAEISVYGLEESHEGRSNYDAYSDYTSVPQKKGQAFVVLVDTPFNPATKTTVPEAQSAKAKMEFAK